MLLRQILDRNLLKIIELNNSTTIVREWVVDYH